MAKFYQRIPKDYDGTKATSRTLTELLPIALAEIDDIYQQKAEIVLAAWPEIIGPALAGMTEAYSFNDGRLNVKVKNSTLLSLLSQNEKPRLLQLLRKRLPKADIKTIFFRLG